MKISLYPSTRPGKVYSLASEIAISKMSSKRGRKRGSTNGVKKRGRYVASRRRSYQARLALPETKYVDGYLDNTAVHELAGNDDTWADTELNPRQQAAVYGCLPIPAQGDGYSDRDGRKCYIKNIRIRGQLLQNAGTTKTVASTQGFVRLLVVKDTRTCGTTIVGEDVLGPGQGSDGAAGLLADTAVSALTNPAGWGKYRVVADKTLQIDNQQVWYDGTDGNLQGHRIPFDFTVKCNCWVNFKDTTGLIASVVDNSFHLIGATSEGDDWTISYIARTSFVG